VKHVETDPESGAEIHQLTEEDRPADNIYGEQPYTSPDGGRIAVRHYPAGDADGGLSVLDLEDGSLHPVLVKMPRFPAFHAWGDYLYYQEAEGDALLLKRCHYRTLRKETVIALPTEEGRFSYGTVSGDHRFYAASVHREDKSCQVLLVDLADGSRRTLADTDYWHFKHEQFSLDGRNRVLIQANSPDVREVRLGTMEVGGEGVAWLAADRPHTPRPTGHEAWVGRSSRVFFSTAFDESRGTNAWTAGVGDPAPAVACRTPTHFGHVSVSRCGRFWVADATGEEGIPLYVGSLASGVCRRLVYSRTAHDGEQWSHTHPYLTADTRWLIFTSNRSGPPQVYGARVPEAFLESL